MCKIKIDSPLTRFNSPRQVMTSTVKKVPVVLNLRQLASDLPESTATVYRAVKAGLIIPDFVDIKSSPYFKSQRLESIRRMLSKVEIT